MSPAGYIDETAEQRQFALEHGVKNRPRAEYVADEMVEDLSTFVQYDGTSRAKQLATITRRLQGNAKHELIVKHIQSIRHIGSQLGLEKSVIDAAGKLCEEAVDAGITKTRKREAIDAACLHHACNGRGVRRSMDDFMGQMRNVTRRELNAAFEAVRGLPSLLLVTEKWEFLAKEYTAPLRLTSWVEAAAIAIAREAREHGICEGKAHVTIVAGAIALACDGAGGSSSRTVEQIKDVIGGSNEVIRERATELEVLRPIFSKSQEWADMLEHAHEQDPPA